MLLVKYDKKRFIYDGFIFESRNFGKISVTACQRLKLQGNFALDIVRVRGYNKVCNTQP
jgi:hypothetical protein